MPHMITCVEHKSVAWLHSIHKGDILLTINGEEVLDQIDYQALTTSTHLELVIQKPDGHTENLSFNKGMYTPLGLHIEQSLACTPRLCHNHCVFCFVEEMAPNLRKTLYVKDDDWRMSLMMGNFVTLTNITDEEMDRIIRRHASPLYISVHATDGDVRCKMMRNPKANRIMEQLKLLYDNGIHFHCQIVLCPGWNDGDILRRTIEDLRSFAPCAETMALVPVGLTKFRDGLEPLAPYTTETAAAVLDIAEEYRQKYMKEIGTCFVFPSDEFYCMAGRQIPAYQTYEKFSQIENGVGMVAMLEEQVRVASKEAAGRIPSNKKLAFVCGVSIAPTIRHLIATYGPAGVDAQVCPVINNYFGTLITVTGLLTATDIIKQLSGIKADIVYLPAPMMRAEDEVLLDGKTRKDIEDALHVPVVVLENNGQALINALYKTEE